MLALKILANRLRANIDPDAAASVAGPVLRLLGTLVQGGELRAEGDTPYFADLTNLILGHPRGPDYVSERG